MRKHNAGTQMDNYTEWLSMRAHNLFDALWLIFFSHISSQTDELFYFYEEKKFPNLFSNTFLINIE